MNTSTSNGPVPGSTRRGGTVLDGMILIAAFAAGIAWTRSLVPIIQDRAGMISPTWRSMPRSATLLWWPAAAVPLLMALSLGVLACRALRPRPPWSTVARQPGAVACLVAAANLAFHLTAIAAGKALGLIPGMTLPGVASGLKFDFLSWRLSGDLITVGYGVLSCWLILALGGVREPESSWVDRMGRVLGASWIAVAVVRHLAIYIRA